MLLHMCAGTYPQYQEAAGSADSCRKCEQAGKELQAYYANLLSLHRARACKRCVSAEADCEIARFFAESAGETVKEAPDEPPAENNK